eukprot:g2835.t1
MSRSFSLAARSLQQSSRRSLLSTQRHAFRRTPFAPTSSFQSSTITCFHTNAPAHSSKDDDSGLTYTQRQDKTGRPISPHVTIYAWPVIALSSVTNRITGCLLGVGVVGISAASVVGADVPLLMSTISQSTSPTLAKLTVAFPLVYHYVAAIRHIYWDKTVEGFTNADMEKTSYLVAGTSLALTAVAGFMF